MSVNTNTAPSKPSLHIWNGIPGVQEQRFHHLPTLLCNLRIGFFA